MVFFGASGFRKCFCRVAKSNLCPGFKYKNNWSRKDSIKYPKVKSEATRISSLLLVCYGHFVKFVFHRPQKIQGYVKRPVSHSEVKLSYSINWMGTASSEFPCFGVGSYQYQSQHLKHHLVFQGKVRERFNCVHCQTKSSYITYICKGHSTSCFWRKPNIFWLWIDIKISIRLDKAKRSHKGAWHIDDHGLTKNKK